jgi:hypothetical protein
MMLLFVITYRFLLKNFQYIKNGKRLSGRIAFEIFAGLHLKDACQRVARQPLHSPNESVKPAYILKPDYKKERYFSRDGLLLSPPNEEQQPPKS